MENSSHIGWRCTLCFLLNHSLMESHLMESPPQWWLRFPLWQCQPRVWKVLAPRALHTCRRTTSLLPWAWLVRWCGGRSGMAQGPAERERRFWKTFQLRELAVPPFPNRGLSACAFTWSFLIPLLWWTIISHSLKVSHGGCIRKKQRGGGGADPRPNSRNGC